MGMLEAFNQLNEVRSFEQVNEEYHQQPVSEWDKNLGDPNAWLDRYTRFVERPRSYECISIECRSWSTPRES